MPFRCGIIQNYGVLAGKGVIFCPGWAGFCWEMAQKHRVFWRGIIQNYGVLPGEEVVFCPGCADFHWGIAQKRRAFSVRDYTKSRSAGGEGGDFSPLVGRFSPGNGPNRPVSARNRPKTPRFRPVLARFCLTFAPCFAKMGSKKMHKNPPGGETEIYIFV